MGGPVNSFSDFAFSSVVNTNPFMVFGVLPSPLSDEVKPGFQHIVSHVGDEVGPSDFAGVE